MWQSDFLTRLRAANTGAGSRIAWYERQRTWKAQTAAVLALDDDGRDYTHDGPSGLDHPELTIDVFAASGTAAEQTVEQIRAVIETPDVTVGGTKFGMGFVRTGRTLGPEDMPDGARVMRRRMLVRFSVEQV